MSNLSKTLIGLALALVVAIGAAWVLISPSSQPAPAGPARSHGESTARPAPADKLDVELAALLADQPIDSSLSGGKDEPAIPEDEPDGAKASPLDLTGYYGMAASDFDKGSRYQWRVVPRGSQTFANVPVEIGGAIFLWGERNAQMGLKFPEQITGIPVSRKFETLYILHGAFYEGPSGTPVYEVVFHFDDGTSAADPIVCGVDLRDWYANRNQPPLGPTGPRSTLAWDADAKMGERTQAIRFCMTAIVNPHPGKEVTAIDLVSSKSQSAACILAISTGNSGLMQRTEEPRPAPVSVPPLASFVAHQRSGTFVLFSNDGKRLISGGNDNLIQVWDMQTGELVRTLLGHTYGVKCGALSPDGKLLVSGSWDQTVRVWDVDSDISQKPLRRHTAPVDAIALAPDGKTMATGSSDRTFRLWNLESRDTIFTSPEQELPVNRLTISPDGKLLATGTGSVSEWKRAGELRLWDAASGEEVATLPGHATCINAVVFSPDGTRLATGTADGMLRIWDVAMRDELLAAKLGSGVRSIAFFADGQMLVIAQWPGQLFLWDLATRRKGRIYAGHEKPEAMVDSVALSPDQSLIASTGTDGMVFLWPVPESTSDAKRRLWKMPGEGMQPVAEMVRHWKN